MSLNCLFTEMVAANADEVVANGTSNGLDKLLARFTPSKGEQDGA